MTHDTNIPQGYKATALGIIPQEWEVMRLGDIVSITSGEARPYTTSRQRGNIHMSRSKT